MMQDYNFINLDQTVKNKFAIIDLSYGTILHTASSTKELEEWILKTVQNDFKEMGAGYENIAFYELVSLVKVEKEIKYKLKIG